MSMLSLMGALEIGLIFALVALGVSISVVAVSLKKKR